MTGLDAFFVAATVIIVGLIAASLCAEHYAAGITAVPVGGEWDYRAAMGRPRKVGIGRRRGRGGLGSGGGESHDSAENAPEGVDDGSGVDPSVGGDSGGSGGGGGGY